MELISSHTIISFNFSFPPIQGVCNGISLVIKILPFYPLFILSAQLIFISNIPIAIVHHTLILLLHFFLKLCLFFIFIFIFLRMDFAMFIITILLQVFLLCCALGFFNFFFCKHLNGYNWHCLNWYCLFLFMCLVGMPNQIKMLHEFVFVVELLKKI